MNWTFLDYVDANGVNRISEWLRSIPVEARVEFQALLDTIKAKPILDRPQTAPFGKLYEFRFKDHVHKEIYRPLFCYGPDTSNREITILVGAKKKNNKMDPPNVYNTALIRAREIRTNRRQVTIHVRI